MKTIEKSSLIDLDKKMKAVAKNYFISRKIQELDELAMKDAEEIEKTQHSVYVRRIERAFNSLSREEQTFINNDYFYEAYPFWWLKQYPPSTYYRIKKKSVINFLKALYNEE